MRSVRRSVSINLHEPDGFETLSCSGGDLSNYQEERAKARNSRTLNLRRRNRPIVPTSPVAAQKGMLDATQYPILEPEKATEIVKSGNATAINILRENIVGLRQSSPKVLSNLLGSQMFVEELANSIASGFSVEAVVLLMEIISTVFPIVGPMMTVIIDEGICFSMTDLLGSGDRVLTEATVSLISAMSGASPYARDAVLCLGVHEVLIGLAKRGLDQENAVHCCQCLYQIFSTPGGIDSDVLIDATRIMFELLASDVIDIVLLMLECFVEMSNKYTALVFVLYDLGMFPLVVSMLETPELIAGALRMIGNLSVAQPSHIRAMLDVGLMPKLVDFVDSEYAADAFWVMSNLMEMVPRVVLPSIDESVVSRGLEIIETSSYDVRKEAAVWLSTIILLSPVGELDRFMIGSILETLVDMLGCGVTAVVMKCTLTLLRFGRAVIARTCSQSAGVEFMRLVCENEVEWRSRLEDILENGESGMLAESVEMLMLQYATLIQGERGD